MAVLGPSIDGGYFHTLRLAAGWGKEVSGFAPVWNRSFAGFTGLVLPGFLASLVAVALDVVTLALFIRLALRRVPFDVLFGLAVVVALLTSQHVLIHDLSLLCIPVAVALRYRSIGPGHLITLLIAADIGVTAGFPLALAVPVQLPTIVMVALAGWLYEAGRSAGREVSATMSTCPLVAEGATAGD
jgi:hypothetical protein